ncbi:hypothetical protein PPROV_000168100 [Pycnococcus provasolii]|uniref:EF hand associated type-2 domain-containing protein n=1 Tax=Pycnococcus provasolii TaxID=41880 RepID=A0A830H6S6_9CHLO|nr:hypothetical protein PPROV_000168100 [Pycnococcus provasolii]
MAATAIAMPTSPTSATTAPVVSSTPVRVVVVGDAAAGKTRLIHALAFLASHPQCVEELATLLPEGGSTTSASAEQWATLATPSWLPSVAPTTAIPASAMPDGVALEVVDTSSDAKGKGADERALALAEADAVVVAYRAGSEEALRRVTETWLPLVRRTCASKDAAANSAGGKVAVPVVLAGCQTDRRVDRAGANENTPEGSAAALEAAARPIMSAFREVETCLECSAANLAQVAEVFYFAQKAVLHPMAPLIDSDTSSLTPKCVRALNRIFYASDIDRDGYLSDEELNAFQVRCFAAPLTADEVAGVKEVVEARCPGGGGLAPQGLTSKGFLFLHALFVERGRSETTWAVLRSHGYDNRLEIRRDLTVPPPAVAEPDGWTHVPDDQRFAITPEAMRYVLEMVDTVAGARPGCAFSATLGRVLSTCPYDPLGDGAPRRPAGVSESADVDDALGEQGVFSLRECAAFASEPGASFAATLEAAAACCPADLCAQLRCLGAPGATSESHGGGVALGPRRRVDGEAGKNATRRVLEVHVFGAPGSGKSALVRCMATPRGAPSHEASRRPRDGRVALGYVTPAGWSEPPPAKASPDGRGCRDSWDSTWRHQRVLLLREVRDLDGYLSMTTSSFGCAEPRVAPFARCDAAAFTVDGSDMASVAAAESAILKLCAAHSESTLAGASPPPCLLVVTKDDAGVKAEVLDAVKELANRFCLVAPCMTSAKRGDFGGAYTRLACLCCERGDTAPVTPEIRAAAAARLCRQRALAVLSISASACAGACAWWWWFAPSDAGRSSVSTTSAK